MFDLIIKGGTIVTAVDHYQADIAIKNGKIAAIGQELDGASETIDATGQLLLPGGIEGHCHIAQESSYGLMTSDDYQSGSISAAFGGNTTFIPFAAQLKRQKLEEVVDVYHQRAETSVLDFGYHLIITDASVNVVEDLPKLFDLGVTSFKVFMTNDPIKMGDAQMLDFLTIAREQGGLVMVHAENNDIIKWTSQRLLDGGYTQPRYHAVSHPAAAEVEAINRAIVLARFVDAPLMTVHVSTPEGADIVAKARLDGAKIYAETCPQYLFLTRDDLDRPGMEGAKFMCSPPVRDVATQEGLWRHLQAGTFDFFSSDHAPYRADETGKFFNGPDVNFRRIANGMPGIGLRLPLLFSEGVNKGRITLNQFVALTSTNAAKTFGMFPQKGTIAVGSDADIAFWDPQLERTVTASEQHDNMDYSPFEGTPLKGWPVKVMSRGEVIVSDGELKAQPGRGRYIARKRLDWTGKPGSIAPELDPATNFGAQIAPKSWMQDE